MAQVENIAQPSLQFWKGVNERMAPTSLPDGVWSKSAGLVNSFDGTASKVLGKRLSHKFTEPVLNLFQIQGGVLVQTLTKLWFVALSEL